MAAAYAALVSLMNVIDALQRHCRPPISLDQTQVFLLTQKVNFLEQFLGGYDSHHAYSKEADPLEIRIADAAYAAEDAIESHIVDLNSSGGDNISSHTQGQIEQTGCLESIKEGFSFVRCLRWPKQPPHRPASRDDRVTSNGDNINFHASLYEALEKVIEEMGLIQNEAIKIQGIVGFHMHRNSIPPLDSLRSSSVMQKSSMVGVDGVLLQMKDKLTSDCRDLQIIPIVGMGGIGKTTLATNIYEDLLIKENFDICAWTTISQKYSIREMLIEFLHHLNQVIGQNLSEDELGEKLYKHLFGRKYIIIMDDMWSIEAWNGVRRFLPNNKNGSRIVILPPSQPNWHNTLCT